MTFHDVYLVESYRDEYGTPRQQTVAYLGNIRQIGEDFPPIERELFLIHARTVLLELEDVSNEEYKNVLQQLQRKVPPLTYHEALLAFQQNLQWFYQWCTAHNIQPPTAAEVQRIISELRRPPEPF